MEKFGLGIVPREIKQLAMAAGEAGSCLISCLVVSVVGCLSLDYLPAIAALQEFKRKEIRDSIFENL